MSSDYCFPNKLEEVIVLKAAIAMNPNDVKALYYLGNFWYAHRRYSEAIASWEQARLQDNQIPTVHRNLGLAYYNKLSDSQRALNSLDTAFALDKNDARVLFELDLHFDLGFFHLEQRILSELCLQMLLQVQ